MVKKDLSKLTIRKLASAGVKSKRVFKKSKRATIVLPRVPGVLERANVL